MGSNLLKILERMLRSYSSFRELFSLTLAKCKPYFIIIARLHICIFLKDLLLNKSNHCYICFIVLLNVGSIFQNEDWHKRVDIWSTYSRYTGHYQLLKVEKQLIICRKRSIRILQFFKITSTYTNFRWFDIICNKNCKQPSTKEPTQL